MDVYEVLRERLDACPPGAPQSETMYKILRLLFSPEEAEISCHLKFTLQSVSELAARTGWEESRLEKVLEGLADRGVIRGVTRENKPTRYSLLPIVPGFMEFTLMRRDRVADYDELARLWHRWTQEAYSVPTPLFRIVPVQEAVPVSTGFLPYQQVYEAISQADYISVTTCACRASARNCDHPLDNCINLGHIAKYLVDRGLARQIERDEALQILQQAEETGLVHSFNNYEQTLSICNCCSCCCSNLQSVKDLARPNTVANSSYEVSFDHTQCIGCLLCTENRCPMGAISPYQDIVAVDLQRCIGCGLCTTVCPSDALAMRPREYAPDIPKDGKELMKILLEQTGRTERFHKINNE